jgi:hypothetical protein
MRTTDPDPKPLGPILGEKVRRAVPASPSAKTVPGAPSGIVQDADGRLRTTTHTPRYP